MAKTYINRRQGSERETVDEFENNSTQDRKYIKEMVSEYQMSDPTAEYYKSTRPCGNWKD
jgi:hypothetical protein